MTAPTIRALAAFALLALPALPPDVRAAPPTAGRPDPLAAAADALARGDPTEAERHASAAVRARPDDKAALQLLAALQEAAGDTAAAETRGRAGPAAKLPPPAPSSLQAGADAWVIAPLLSMRRKPAGDAPIAGWLPFGVKVRVLGVERGYARIRRPVAPRGARTVVRIARDGASRLPTAEHFLHAGFLSPKALHPAELVTRGDAAEKAGAREEALRWHSAAAEAVADDDTVRARTVRLALELGYPDVAVRVAGGSRGRWSGIVAEKLEVLYGCRGDLTKAEVFSQPQDPEALPANACVRDVEVFAPCPPLDPAHGLSDASLAESEEQREAALAQYEVESEAHREAAATRAAAIEALDGVLTTGPFLHLVLRNHTDGYGPPLRTIRVVPPPPTCETPEPARYEGEGFLDLPALPPRATLDVWLELDRYTGVNGLLTFSADPQDALGDYAGPGEPSCEVLCM